ncbi:WD40-repeat-containing domain protein, partial [Butyriboletus roseoflavus]
PIEIDAGNDLKAVRFSPTGEYLVSGSSGGVGVWRVEDGTKVATMAANYVRCLAVSKNGRWIAVATLSDKVIVWDAKTYEQVFSHQEDIGIISAVDFDAKPHQDGVDGSSRDSTRLVLGSSNTTASVLDIATRKRVLGPLRHGKAVIAVKYSPQGDRIATAAYEGQSVRVYDSDDGRLLVDIKATVTPQMNNGLLWSNDQLIIVSDGKIKRIEASTGSTVSEWPIPNANENSCIALPQHGEFIAYSTNDTVTFWDMSTHAQLGLIRHTQDIRSLTFS